MNAFDPQTFEETVSQVVAEHQEAKTARMEKQEAEAALLARIIEMAKPALMAIGTRPVIRYEVAHHEDVNYCGGDRTEERTKERYVPLSDTDFEPGVDHPRANEGRYQGRTLAVRANDGQLVCFTFSGDWSRWQGSCWGYEAEITEYESAQEALADGWHERKSVYTTGPRLFIQNLTEQLTNAVGKRQKSTEADRKRAEKLGAVTQLIGR